MTEQPKDVLSVLDVAERLPRIVGHAIRLKTILGKNGTMGVAKGRTLGLLFEKASTRTRLSFEVGFRRLGGTVLHLSKDDMQLGRGETIRDTAMVFSRMLDAVMYRAFRNQDVVELARHTTIPVINGLDDVEHPCQAIADVMTLVEHFGDLKGRTVAYVGDAGNNVARSYLYAFPRMGMHLRLLAPPGYRPEATVLQEAQQLAVAHGGSVEVDEFSPERLAGAQAVATDTWVSMGDEEEAAARLRAFEGHTITPQVLKHAEPGAVFLHCLPAHYGHEVTEDVVYGPQSLVFEEAENRMWAQMSLLLDVMGLQPWPEPANGARPPAARPTGWTPSLDA